MKVKTLTRVIFPTGSFTPAGVVVDLPDERAADWIKRGIAEKLAAPPPPAAPQPPKPFVVKK